MSVKDRYFVIDVPAAAREGRAQFYADMPDLCGGFPSMLAEASATRRGSRPHARNRA